MLWKMNTIEDIGVKIEKLPEHVKPELNDFIEFLSLKYGEEISQSYPNYKFEMVFKRMILYRKKSIILYFRINSLNIINFMLMFRVSKNA